MEPLDTDEYLTLWLENDRVHTRWLKKMGSKLGPEILQAYVELHTDSYGIKQDLINQALATVDFTRLADYFKSRRDND